MSIKNKVWFEKYRPKELSDFLFQDDLKDKIQARIKEQQPENLILYGSAGVGKTSIVNYLLNNLDCEVLVINGSIQNKIDDVRDVIFPFLRKGTLNQWKIIDIREFDRFTQQAQEALKDEIESSTLNCRFFLTTNNLHKIDPAIRSRCTTIQVEPSNEDDVFKRIIDILSQENIKYTPEDEDKIKDLVKSLYPDIRNIIQEIQSFCYDGKLHMFSTERIRSFFEEMVAYLSMVNKSNYLDVYKNVTRIVTTVSDNYLNSFYTYLHENSHHLELSPEKQFELIIILNEHDFRSTFSVNKKINILACLKSIIELKKR